MSPLTFAMSAATRNFAQIFNYFISGQPFLETFMPLSYSYQDYAFMAEHSFPCSKISNSIFALTLGTHILLRHLAAVILSQFNNYFLLPTRLVA